MTHKKTFKASLLAFSLSAIPLATHAAGLGSINVMSALGQPLRAEIEINATAQEMNSLTAKLASADAFQQAGIPLSNVTSGLRIQVENTKKGAVVKVTSDKPINEPFVDILLEVSWGSGRITREYTFLLDPPNLGSAAPKVAVDEKGRRLPKVAADLDPNASIDAQGVANAPASTKSRRPKREPKVAAEGSTANSGEGYVTQKGDTLYKLASEHAVEGASLDQMMLALFKNNRSAFIGNNINRLRAGAAITMPTEADATAVSNSQARRQLYTRDFNQAKGIIARHAAASTSRAGKSGGAGGQVVDQATAISNGGKNRVEISSGHPGKAGAAGQAAGGALQEDLVAQKKALSEAQARVKELEEIDKKRDQLLQLKNKQIADLESAAKNNATKVAAAPVVKPETAKPPVPAPQPEAAVKSPAPAPQPEAAVKPPAPAPQPEAAVKPPVPAPQPEMAVKPPEPVTAQPEAPKSDTSPPVQKPKRVTPPPPPPEPSFMDQLMDNLPLVGGGLGGIAALVLGAVWWKRRKRNQEDDIDEDAFDDVSGFPDSQGPSSSGGGGAFAGGAKGGRDVNTSGGDHSSSALTDFSQSGLTAFDTDEGVDPVAEADVYMAYGRDAQAEEILLDALKTDANRPAVHLKLLEIYQQRNDTKRFETTATELYALTHGAGAEWDKAAEMGRKLDPANPLFQKGAQKGASPAGKSSAVAPAAAVAVASAAATAAAIPVLKEVSDITQAKAEAIIAPAVSSTVEAVSPSDSHEIDFDLGDEDDSLFVETGSTPDSPQHAGTSVDFEANFVATQPGIRPLEDAVKAEEALALPSHEQAPAMEFDLSSSAFDKLDAGQNASVSTSGVVSVTPTIPAAVVAHQPAKDAETTFLEDSGIGLGSEDNVIDLTKTAFDGSLLDFDLDLDTGEPRGHVADLALDELGLGNKPAPDQALILPKDVGLETVLENDTKSTLIKGDFSADSGEIQTKFELAKAYKDMGDADGARELLEEILKEGNPLQQNEARTLIAGL